MAWYKVTLTNKQIEEQRALQNLRKEFEKSFIAADAPEDMALFSENEYHDDRIAIYFTPGCDPHCVSLITQYHGEECDPPALDQVFLLDGNDDALDLLTRG